MHPLASMWFALFVDTSSKVAASLSPYDFSFLDRPPDNKLPPPIVEAVVEDEDPMALPLTKIAA